MASSIASPSVRTLVVLASLLFPCLAVPQACSAITPAATPVFATGYSGRVVVNGLKSPRGIMFDTKDNLLIVEQGGGGIRRIKFTDNGGTDVCVKSSTQIIKDNTVTSSPTSIKFYSKWRLLQTATDHALAQPWHRTFSRWTNTLRLESAQPLLISLRSRHGYCRRKEDTSK